MEKIREILRYQENSLKGRYIADKEITPLLERHSAEFPVQAAGTSEEGREVYQVVVGKGSFKVLIWSQMHGNESTTTKAIFDLFNFLREKSPLQQEILKQCTLIIIPMLNPDGAAKYTRVNANSIDLNRDALLLTQKESRILRDTFEKTQPNLCLNMHDQRTIYSVSGTDKPATVSFLAPAADKTKKITETRKKAMSFIAEMYKELEKVIPGQIGRYDDTFNPNCVGDAFQVAEVPTILFEAGHFQGDYQREESRKLIFYALIILFKAILNRKEHLNDYKEYFEIPENLLKFRDILIKNAKIQGFNNEVSIAIQFEEQLKDEEIHFIPKIDFIGLNPHLMGHQEVDAEGKKVSAVDEAELYEGQTINKLKIGVKNIQLT